MVDMIKCPKCKGCGEIKKPLKRVKITLIELGCVTCGNKFQSKNKNAKTCSYKCRTLRMSYLKRSKSINTLPNYLVESIRGKY